MSSHDSQIDKWKVPLYKILVDEDDVKSISNVVKRGTSWAIGPEIVEFENQLKNFVGSDYCLTFNSGTSALHATNIAYDLTNSEVIIPSFSFIATSNSVLFVNGVPIFADIEKSNLGLDPNSVQSKITNQTKAIITVDYAGLPSRVNDLKNISNDSNLSLIEDAAQSFGSSIHGKKIGTIADTTIFSFASNKLLTTGEGGAIVTNSKEIFEKIKLLRSHGRTEQKSYFDSIVKPEYVELGYNWRMSSLTAAIGLSQISKIHKILKLRKDNADFYSSKLKKLPHITTPDIPQGYEHVFQFYTVFLSDTQVRDGLQKFLTKHGIMSKIFFEPIHLTPFYKNNFKTKEGMLPVTESVSQHILTLPMYAGMTSEEREYVVDHISQFCENL